jgi:DNA helicase HerA-like ATPase
MNLSLSQQATLNFYEWEHFGRGYYLFDRMVDIEPPYRPFYFRPQPIERIDDGKLTLLGSLSKLFTKKEEKENKESLEELSIHPKYINFQRELKGFSVSFNHVQEISPLVSLEFLNMLSHSTDTISFEVLASSEKITIQFICSVSDLVRVQSNLKAYFPHVLIKDIDVYDLGFNLQKEIAIADFGYHDEFMRPIHTAQSFSIDTLTSLVASMDNLKEGETVLFQIIFKSVSSPWVQDITRSVSDGSGGSFFSESPEMITCAKEKVSFPLYGVIIRIATQGINNDHSGFLAEGFSNSITNASKSQFNHLIPLSNEGYAYGQHLHNVMERRSNRLGMIMNSQELVSFVHYPNSSVVSQKLRPNKRKTKLLPKICLDQKYVLGTNEHNGEQYEASIDDGVFGRHILLAGSTGTGKTHLLKQLIYQDVGHCNATFILDPHGDLANDILLNIKEKDKDRLVFINIADEQYSFGFNIFSAKSDIEKVTLSSDLMGAFSGSWISSGDRINSVLQKTISTFLYSKKEASILDMKRFLLEKGFRNEFLESLDDPILSYYWEQEFPLVKRGELSPLLLRIDNFMQTRLLRNMFAQTKGIDFSALVEGNKVVIFQLSVGLIGLENSKFIAKLLIAKINQVAFAQQSVSIVQRRSIHFYIDEAHIYANSPAIEQILSGARKYSLSLVLVLQHLDQVESNILNSLLTNTATQVFFRQSERDSKRISSSFSFFEPEDFMELDLGEALVRVNMRNNDFNLKTLPLESVVSSEEAEGIKAYIVQNSREIYALSMEEIYAIQKSIIPEISKNNKNEVALKETKIKVVEEEKSSSDQISDSAEAEADISKLKANTKKDINLEGQKKSYLENEETKQTIRKHRSLQNLVKTLAEQRGFKATIEEEVNGGRVDVGLLRDNMKIAVEISVSNSVEYEISNIQKCLDASFHLVYMMTDNTTHLTNIQAKARKEIEIEEQDKIHFITTNDLPLYLDALTPTPEKKVKRIRGYRVKINQSFGNQDEMAEKQQSITATIMRAFQRKKKS